MHMNVFLKKACSWNMATFLIKVNFHVFSSHGQGVVRGDKKKIYNLVPECQQHLVSVDLCVCAQM